MIMEEVEQCFNDMEAVWTTPTNRLSNQTSFFSSAYGSTIKELEGFSDYLPSPQNTQGNIVGENDERDTLGFETNFEKIEDDLKDKNSDKIDSKRTDVLFKSSLRFVRNQFRDLFKYHNKNVVKNRYVNWKTKKMFEYVKETLSQLLSEECISDSLVYYWIGIFKLKDYRKITCPTPVKKEVEKFLGCIKNFSKARFYDVMSTKNCKTLCHYLINSSANDERTKVLKQFCE